jgi:hypothetical protein
MVNFKWVERYVERGFACHWLHGKAPYQKDWSTLPVATLEELKRSYFPYNNLGVRIGKWSVLEPGYGLVVLDIDLRDPLGADACYEAVERFLGHAELTVASGRGLGGHVYMTCPLDRLPSKAATTLAVGQGWKLELFSTGKQVVLPPSVHPDTGKRYEWVSGEIVLVPESLLNAPGIERDRSAMVNSVAQAPEGTSNVIAPVGGYVCEGERNNYLFRWAMKLQHDGYFDRDIIAWTHARNMDRCSPPLPEEEVDTILRSVLSQPKGR